MKSFGVVLAITNPLSTGYYAVIAALNAWNKIADEIVIVDGGSDDGSIDFIKKMDLNWNKIHIVSNEFTFWGKGDDWDILQLLHNLNYGLNLLDTKWAWAFSADYIPYQWTKGRLEDELRKYDQELWVRTFVGKPIMGKIEHKINKRNIIFNLTKIRQDKVKLVYGINEKTGIPSDFPVLANAKTFFLDPSNNCNKIIYRGFPIDSEICLDLEVIAYGHFFYNVDKLDHKIQRWDKAFSRFLGISPARLKQLRLWHNVPEGKKRYSLSEIMQWSHPDEIKEVLKEYYFQGMIGGIVDDKTKLEKRLNKYLLDILKFERKLRTMILILSKKLKPERDELIWEKIG